MLMQTTKAFAEYETIDLDALLFAGAAARAGLIAGTRIEAASGWRPVESLTREDAVFTYDGGLRPIRDIRREELTPARLLHVPGGALGNCAAMELMPGQHLLIEDDIAEEVFGSPLVLLPAASLAGWNGIRWIRGHASELVRLTFDDEELVWSNSGTLLHCPAEGAKGSKFFTTLNMDQARAMVSLMQDMSNPFRLHAAA